MKSSTTIAVLFLGMLGLFSFGCAESAPSLAAPATPAAPAANEETPRAPEESATPDQSAGAHSLDVGMEFKEKDESEHRRASHDAPPTGAWKPVDKDKSIDGRKNTTSK